MRHWRSLNLVSLLLLPLAGLFWLAAALRRWMYALGWLNAYQVGVPVVVVGNITAGGTGKTPLVIALARALQQRGYRPGVVSRGYGGSHVAPQLVSAESDPASVGDEPVLIAWKTGAPVAVGRDRVAAARLLLARSPGVDVLLSDDGLQHYRLHRNVELVVVDGAAGLGNGLPLPAGPLREPARRLQTADAVLITRRNGEEGRYKPDHPRAWEISHGPGQLYRLREPSDRKDPVHGFNESINAVAGIARPENFFRLLRGFGLDVRPHAFPDHHVFTAADLPKGGVVLMTEKDAVKCRKFAGPDWWVLEWDARPDEDMIAWLAEAIDPISHKNNSATDGAHQTKS